jgi:hypothetical protein
MRFIFALALVISSTAHAADLVPETTPDGYSALVAQFPLEATQVCIVREDSPGEPECRVKPIGRGALQVALFLRKLEPGSVYCTYAVGEGGMGPLSTDCWVGPVVKEETAK